MRVLITAGPTREPIDPVRYLSNRSSGRVGVAIAEASRDAGHEVRLLLGPTAVTPDPDRGIDVHGFESVNDLRDRLGEHFAWCDVLVMAAAVNDYRPARVSATKIARASEGTLNLQLEPTPDLVADVARRKRDDQRVVAFALEDPENLEARATAKLTRKSVDAIVANPIATLDSGDIRPVWLTASGGSQRLEQLPKTEFARWLVARLESLAGGGTG